MWCYIVQNDKFSAAVRTRSVPCYCHIEQTSFGIGYRVHARNQRRPRTF